MDWSKARRLLESRFAASVQGRVAVHVTRYRRAHDQEGELWLTMDSAKIYGSSFYQFCRARNELQAKEHGFDQGREEKYINNILWARGIADHIILRKAAEESLNHSVEQMFRSPHPLIRTLAVLDSRTGSRRLAKLDITHEHELVLVASELRRSRSSLEPTDQSTNEVAVERL